jgi:7-carboxy-7-deazaguanine synthase
MSPTMKDEADSLEVCELFRSIAGETSHAGFPASFVRLSGCNLRCHWCDTQRAWKRGLRLPVAKLLEMVLATGDRRVVITGGEPLLQPGTNELCEKLLRAGREVILETNGSLDVSRVPAGVRIILDVKTPSSGESHKMDPGNFERLKAGDELKFVMADREDFDWSCEILDEHNFPESVNILFSPVSERVDPGEVARWLLGSGRQVRIQIQLHKVLWADGTDGVQILDGSKDSG